MAKDKGQKEASTEEKIREAAQKVFTRKGYAATRTRDIAEEAGINLALLNYYFRSKEKLFGIIIKESRIKLFLGIRTILNDETTTLDEKIQALISHYTDMLIEHPDLPIFIMSEMRANPEQFMEDVGVKSNILQSFFVRQYQEDAKARNIKPLDPLQLMVTFVGMIVFPFIARPLLEKMGNIDQEQFFSFMREREKLAPKWIRALMDIS